MDDTSDGGKLVVRSRDQGATDPRTDLGTLGFAISWRLQRVSPIASLIFLLLRGKLTLESAGRVV